LLQTNFPAASNNQAVFSTPIKIGTNIPANSFFSVSEYEEDFDGDGIPNGIELQIGTSPANSDSDGNGVSDGEEDFDGDGFSNAEEVQAGTDLNTADDIFAPDSLSFGDVFDGDVQFSYSANTNEHASFGCYANEYSGIAAGSGDIVLGYLLR